MEQPDVHLTSDSRGLQVTAPAPSAVGVKAPRESLLLAALEKIAQEGVAFPEVNIEGYAGMAVVTAREALKEYRAFGVGGASRELFDQFLQAAERDGVTHLKDPEGA